MPIGCAVRVRSPKRRSYPGEGVMETTWEFSWNKLNLGKPMESKLREYVAANAEFYPTLQSREHPRRYAGKIAEGLFLALRK